VRHESCRDARNTGARARADGSRRGLEGRVARRHELRVRTDFDTAPRARKRRDMDLSHNDNPSEIQGNAAVSAWGEQPREETRARSGHSANVSRLALAESLAGGTLPRQTMVCGAGSAERARRNRAQFLGAGTPTRAGSFGAGTPTRAGSFGAGTPTRAGSLGAGTPTRAGSLGAGTPTRARSLGAGAPTCFRPDGLGKFDAAQLADLLVGGHSSPYACFLTIANASRSCERDSADPLIRPCHTHRVSASNRARPVRSDR
jgi:hypothetical protein